MYQAMKILGEITVCWFVLVPAFLKAVWFVAWLL